MTAQQLKNSILQMAVQGKLVPQDPNDEPASVLLERIRAEKEQLIKQKKIKREKNPSVIFKGADNTPYEKTGNEVRSLADEVPFDIPENWEWARLGQIVFSRGQCTPQTDFCYIDIGSIDNKHQRLSSEETIIAADKAPSRARKIVAVNDILYSTVRPYLHNMCIIDRDFSCTPIASTGFAAMTCHDGILNRYLLYYLMSPDFDAYANNTDNSKGVAYPAINDDRLYKALIPIPPAAEQRRIVDKIESLEETLSIYGDKETELRLLNEAFPDKLKKSILQMAVQGKLTVQNPADEPAAVLLERIRSEKEQLIRAGKIKRDKHESVIFRRDNSHYEKCGSEIICIDDTIPFDIPDTWAWVRLRSVLEQASTGPFGSMLHKDDYTEEGIPIVNPANIADRRVIEHKIKRVSSETADRLKSYMLHSGDVIIGRRGEMGRSAVVMPQQEGWLCGTGCFYVTPLPGLSPEYLSFLLSSPYIRNALTESSVGTTMNNLNHSILGDLLIPLPPVNEQIQIIQQYKNVISIIGD